MRTTRVRKTSPKVTLKTLNLSLVKVLDILNQHSNKFESIDQRFESIDQRFKSIDQRFESIDQRFKSIDQRFKSIDQRFKSIDKTLNDHSGILKRVADKLVLLEHRMGEMNYYMKTSLVTKEEFNKFVDSEDAMVSKVESVDQETTVMGRQMNRFDSRITKTEEDITSIKTHVGMV